MSVYDRQIGYDGGENGLGTYRRAPRTHIHDDRFVGRQTINCNRPDERYDVLNGQIPSSGRATFAFVLSILLTIAFIVLVWDLYRDGSTTYLRRAFNGANSRGISFLPATST